MLLPIIITVFARSDAAATIYFSAQFVWRLFESGDYSIFLSVNVRRVEWLPIPGRQSAQKRPHSFRDIDTTDEEE